MRRLVIGISGASGAVYGIRALQTLRDIPDIETHLVLSPSAKRTFLEETDWDAPAVEALDQFDIPHQLFKRWKETAGVEALRSVVDP